MALILLGAGAMLLGVASLAMTGAFREPPFRLLFLLALWTVAGLALVLWAWMLAECALHEPENSAETLTWVLIILVAPVIGAAIYYFGRRSRRLPEARE
jgi:cell division protein FtsW (lipid II flippase)